MEHMTGNIRKRKFWLAILLHILLPGFGHFYNSRFRRGSIFFLLYESISFISIFVALYLESALLLGAYYFISLGIWLYGLADVIIITKSNKYNFQLRIYNNRWYKYLIVWSSIFIFSQGLSRYTDSHIFDIKRAWQTSMQNTLFDGDIIIIKRFSLDRIKNNDIIDFNSPMEPYKKYIKRCIALENQAVEIKNGDVYVDEKLIPAPSTAILSDPIPGNDNLAVDSLLIERNNMPLLKIPHNCIFVLGDNRSVSLDSREFGPVYRNEVTGKVLFVLFSTGMKPETGANIIYKLYETILKARWSRIGSKVE